MKLAFYLLIALVAAMMLYIRFSTVDPAKWHVASGQQDIGDYPTLGSFTSVRSADADALVRLREIALATPRTAVLAGSAEAGMVTFVTRSALWGFPDYTTAEYADGVLKVHGRLRFGKGDTGVNRARVTGWLADLDLANP